MGEPAREFKLSKLLKLGIVIDNELDIHRDMVVYISENEYHIDFSVIDIGGEVYEGHIKVVDGEMQKHYWMASQSSKPFLFEKTT